jgi:putative hemolysin
VDYLRWRTYILGYTPRRSLRLPVLPRVAKATRPKPLSPPQNPTVLRQEISRLPAEQLLTRSGCFTVRLAAAHQIPRTLLEIGRLRELSFRAASEGTGKSLDLDRFDSVYLHLFIWNEDSMEIVGAYRLGPTDRIIESHGKQGLYTNTLFRSRIEFFRKIGPALEMGRSFIRPEYQKSYSSLLLLWKGIGSFIAREPRCRVLFGPVSISRDYSDLARRLIATTLLQHSQAKDLAVMVRPRKPAPLKPIRVPGCNRISPNISFQDFKEVCALIADIEFQQKDMPVLLRHYLNLGGQLLAFNIDRDFGDVMDGLIMVDLLRTDRKTLHRYMGADGLAALLAYHDSALEEETGMFNMHA